MILRTPLRAASLPLPILNIICPHCDGTSYIDCASCKGYGYFEKYCPYCDGLRVISTPCTECKGKGKIVKYCCGRIHTNRDTVANVENIEFLTNSLTEYINNL